MIPLVAQSGASYRTAASSSTPLDAHPSSIPFHTESTPSRLTQSTIPSPSSSTAATSDHTSASASAPAPAPATTTATTHPSSSTASLTPTAPSFVGHSLVHNAQASPSASTSLPSPQHKSSNTHGVLFHQAGQPSPLAQQKRAAAQVSRRSSVTRKAQQLDPYLQTVDEGRLGAAFRPPSPSLAPPITLSYTCRPEAAHFPAFAALIESLPNPVHRFQAHASAIRTSESTPAPSSISTHPSSPLTSEHPDLAASSLTEATSIAPADSDATSNALSTTSTTAVTPQIAPPKLNVWGTPKSWADSLGRSGLNSKGPIGVSVHVGHGPASPASDTGSSSVPRSPKAGNGKKAARKSGLSQAKPSVMSLERLLADAHTRFDAPITHPRGLVNKGNFCFANAILQTLVYCAPFYNLFSLVGREVPADFGNATPLMEAVIHFLREFLPADANASPDDQDASITAASEPFAPEFVYDAMRLNKRFDQMRRGHQEDAQEFLGFFLDTLHEELISAQRRSAIKLAQSSGGANGILAKMSEEEKKLNGVSDDDLRRLGVCISKDAASSATMGLGLETALDEDEIIEREVTRPVSPSEEGWMEVGQKGKTAYTRTTSTSESPITRIFGGKLRSVLKTPGAKDSVTLEPYQPLQLDIQPAHVQSIEDALLHLTEPEIIPGVWSPSRGSEVDATKQVFIESLPPVLVLHLKRFLYDEIGGVQKSQKPLSYGTTLEIAPEVLSPAMRAQPRPRYRLFGIVYHHGRYASGGHYTVDVLRQDGHSWLHIDDTIFHTVPTEHVVRTATSVGRDHGHDGLAYLLFYRRELPGEAATKEILSTAPTSKTANGSLTPSSIATAPPAKAKQQHNGGSGTKTLNPVAASVASSSPHGAHASPRHPAIGDVKSARKSVPGWDR